MLLVMEVSSLFYNEHFSKSSNQQETLLYFDFIRATGFAQPEESVNQ